MTDLHPNARRVADAARELGLDIEVRTFPAGTKTAFASIFGGGNGLPPG